MSNVGSTHWCYQCSRHLRLEGVIACPYCEGGFVQELSEISEDVLPNSEDDSTHPIPDLFELMYTLMRQRSPDPRWELMDFNGFLNQSRMAGGNTSVDVRGRTGLLPEQGWNAFGSGQYVVLNRIPSPSSNGSPGSGPRRADFDDYFMGPGFEAFMEAAAGDDDDLDLFGDETEEDKKAAEEREAAKKPAKKKESGKSSVLLDVKPWDDETDMKKLEEAVRSVEIPGLFWGASKLVAVGYGIKKLQIMLTIVDDLVSVDDLIEERLTVEPCNEYVQSCDIVAFNKI